MAAGADTFVSGILGLTGARNVFADKDSRYPEILPDELRAGEPEVVFLSSEPFPFKEEHAAELAQLTGLPRSRFALVDGEFLSWHGSRTPAGIDYAEQCVTTVVAARG
jgi:ABC-type Fe3+-hydroxamate transport system substrate-binding protein